jgi:glucose uptake protein GlcU
MPTTAPAPEEKGTSIWEIIGAILGAIVIGVIVYWFLRQRMTRT